MNTVERSFETEANEIIKQLGGIQRLYAMIGAHNFIRSDKERYMAFKFKQKTPEKINYVKITLNSMDTYDIEFGWIRGLNYTVRTSLSGIYGDTLRQTVADTIKLNLAL